MRFKNLVLLCCLLGLNQFLFAQAKCYDEYTDKFTRNGADPVPDGMQKVVAAVKEANGNSLCYEGEIMVKNGTMIPPLYMIRENGTRTVVYGKFDENWYHQAATGDKNYSIEQGMSAVFMLLYDRKGRLFFTDYVKPDAGGVVKAPDLKKSEQVASTDLEKINVSAKSVQFKTGKATLTENSFALLDAVAELMMHYPNNKWAIDGFTDNVGNADKNVTLSENRAQAVADYLVKKGVPAANLYVNGHGADQPIADNATADGRKQNRRVEIKPI